MSTKKLQTLFTITLALLFLVNGNEANAQEEYFPNETMWSSAYSAFGIPQSGGHTVLCGDTLINDRSYKKIYQYTASTAGGYVENFLYPLREEGQQVWIYRGDEEELLYDFSIAVGDTFSVDVGIIVNLIVESITYDMMHGVQRKTFHFKPVNGFIAETWYEGIGSSNGFLNRGKGYWPDGGSWLCCLKIDNELLYSSTSPGCDCSSVDFDDLGVNCQILSSIEPDFENELSINLFPNPSNGMVTIKGNVESNLEIEIYDIRGALLVTKNVAQGETINLSHLTSGVYFTKIIGLEKNQSQLKKLIIN